MALRTQGRGFLGTLAAILLVLLVLCDDSLLNIAMNAAGNALVGARVEFSGVHLAALQTSLRWTRLQVTNPNNTWYNLFETGPAVLRISPDPLLSKRFIFDNAQLDSMRFNTRRSYNGALAGHRQYDTSSMEGRLEGYFQRIEDQAPIIGFLRLSKFDVDSIWKKVDLKTPQVIDSLQKETKALAESWSKEIQDLADPQQIARLREQLDSLSNNKFESAAQILAAMRQVSVISRRIDSLKTVLSGARNDLSRDIAVLRSYDSLVEQSVIRDHDRILALAHVPRLSADDITRVLFGPAIVDQYRKVLTYVHIARSYGERLQKLRPPKAKNPPRLRGQTIRFSDARNWPPFWLKRASFSGRIMRNLAIGGSVFNIVADQKTIGKPSEVRLSGTGPNGTSLGFSGVFDYLENQPNERFTLNVQRLPFDTILLSTSPLLPVRADSGLLDAAASIAFDGDQFSAAASFAVRKLSLQYRLPAMKVDPAITRFGRLAAQSIKEVKVQTKASMIHDRFSFTATSDIGESLVSALQQALKPQLDSISAQVLQRIYANTGSKRQDLRTKVSDDNRKMQNLLTKQDEQLSLLSAQADSTIAVLKSALLRKVQ